MTLWKIKAAYFLLGAGVATVITALCFLR